MKDSTLVSSEIDLEIAKTVHKLFKHNAFGSKAEHRPSRCRTLADELKDRPVIGISFESIRYYHILRYLVIFHYYPIEERIWFYLFMDLETHIRDFSNNQWLVALLSDKENFLKWLEVQKTMDLDTFFASVCSKRELERTFCEIVYCFEEHLRRPTRKVRRRGYNDKGSLPDSNRKAIKAEEDKDVFVHLSNLEEELRLEIRLKEITLLQDFLMEGKTLSNDQLIRFKIKTIKEINNETKRTDSGKDSEK